VERSFAWVARGSRDWLVTMSAFLPQWPGGHLIAFAALMLHQFISSSLQGL
jgi:hypothetical protein